MRAAVSDAARPFLRGLNWDTAERGCGSLHTDSRCALRQPARRVRSGGRQLRHLNGRHAVRRSRAHSLRLFGSMLRRKRAQLLRLLQRRRTNARRLLGGVSHGARGCLQPGPQAFGHVGRVLASGRVVVRRTDDGRRTRPRARLHTFHLQHKQASCATIATRRKQL